jgi:hypothetical protein
VSAGIPRDLRGFAEGRSGVEAVIQRIGKDTVELILVDADGEWAPGVFGSDELAQAAAGALGVDVHQGWTEELSKRVNDRDAWKAPGAKRRAL